MRYFISAIFIVLASLSQNSISAANTKLCQYATPVTHFTQSLNKINKIKHNICSGEQKIFSFPEIAAIIKPAVDQLELEYQSKFAKPLWIRPWLSKAREIGFYGQQSRLKKFDTIKVGGVLILQYGATNLNSNFQISNCITCSRAIDEMGGLLNHLIYGFRSDNLANTKEYLGLLSKEWDRYMEEARSQTWLDEIVTNMGYEPDLDQLIGPPATQYFLLHPSIVIENVSDALSAEQQEEALAVELFGFNRWQGDIPFGMSVGFIYSNRESIDDTGKAIFVHLDNTYTFGYSKYDTESGWFVSVDLLKLFGDKKENLKEWKQKIKDKTKGYH